VGGNNQNHAGNAEGELHGSSKARPIDSAPRTAERGALTVARSRCLARIGEAGWGHLLLLLIPIVNLSVLVDLWSRAADQAGVNNAWSWLVLVPFVGWIAPWVILSKVTSEEWRPLRA
jgi:hypothetical protein